MNPWLENMQCTYHHFPYDKLQLGINLELVTTFADGKHIIFSLSFLFKVHRLFNFLDVKSIHLFLGQPILLLIGCCLLRFTIPVFVLSIDVMALSSILVLPVCHIFCMVIQYSHFSLYLF